MYSLSRARARARMGDGRARDRDQHERGRRTWHFGQRKKLVDLWQLSVIWCHSSFIGIMIGILPAPQASAASIAYNETRRASPDPDSFGKGNPEGVATAESVNNADNAAAMIPALTLGIPGSAIATLMLGALLIHGFQPGSSTCSATRRTSSTGAAPLRPLQMFLTSAVLLFVGGQLATRLLRAEFSACRRSS